MKISDIAIDLIDPPARPHRLVMDEAALRELADSMTSLGLLTPILVRPTTGGRYEIIAGHRRYTAAKILQWDTIAAIERHDLEPAAELGRFAENLQRTDLSPMEEAVAVSRLATDGGLTADDIAARLHRSPSWVRSRQQLMLVPEQLAELVHTGTLGVGAALQLARVTDPTHRQFLTRYAIEGGAAAPVIRAWVDEWAAAVDAGRADAAPLPDWTPDQGRIIVMMPCYLCAAPHEHLALRIIRVCAQCAQDLAAARGSGGDLDKS